jgi:dUTP pyrophosphatase
MVKKLPVLIVAETEFLPTYAHPGDAGSDLRSRITCVISAGQRSTLPTGVSIAIPSGFVGLVHSRSGLAAKYGICVLNAPGTVDAGYRGEISVTLLNTSDQDFTVSAGDRIAQIMFQAVEIASFVAVEKLPESHRGESGFGSTGRS